MQRFIELFFTPPPMPPIRLSLPVRAIPGAKAAIEEAFKLAYYRGVWDGFMAGVLLVTIIFLLATRRRT